MPLCFDYNPYLAGGHCCLPVVLNRPNVMQMMVVLSAGSLAAGDLQPAGTMANTALILAKSLFDFPLQVILLSLFTMPSLCACRKS